ncbi:MAG: phosphoribosylformylglycinamidine synthase II, partial [Sphingomonas sp.]|nr:phosphoribosylformylglycinamidine synthase II [Sphingomonas sp.]
LWLNERLGRSDGPPPAVDLQRELRVGVFVRELIRRSLVTAVHDISDGGLAVSVAEMALAGGIGGDVSIEDAGPKWLFGEEQGRYLVTTSASVELEAFAADSGVDAMQLGETGGDKLVFHAMDYAEVPLHVLRAAHEGFFPKLMGADAALA